MCNLFIFISRFNLVKLFFFLNLYNKLICFVLKVGSEFYILVWNFLI